MHQYYLYQHRRDDNQEIFYVGIGKKVPKRIKGVRTEFERAYAKSKRTDFWKNIINKTTYKVEIILESDNLDFIKNKEIELIKFYGRRCCDSNGTLVNFDVGGNLNTGIKNRNIKITQLTLSGTIIKVWDQLADIEKETTFLKTNIVKCCRHKQISAYGFKWMYTQDRSFDHIYSSARRSTGKSNNRVGIIVTNRNTLDELLFRCQNDCANYFNLHRSTIHKYLNKKTINKLYIFKYRTHKQEAMKLGLSKSKL